MLLCFSALMLNFTTIPYNDQDLKAFTRAQHVCSTDERYEGCLIEFIKRKQGIYRVICGKKQKLKGE